MNTNHWTHDIPAINCNDCVNVDDYDDYWETHCAHIVPNTCEFCADENRPGFDQIERESYVRGDCPVCGGPVSFHASNCTELEL